jgi:zona occludens toxin (predicted ATPase)
MEKCPGIFKSSIEVMVLDVEFSEKTLLNSSEIINKTLQNPKLQSEIQNILLDEARRLSAKQWTVTDVTVDDSKQLLKKASKPFVNIAAWLSSTYIVHG